MDDDFYVVMFPRLLLLLYQLSIAKALGEKERGGKELCMCVIITKMSSSGTEKKNLLYLNFSFFKGVGTKWKMRAANQKRHELN